MKRRFFLPAAVLIGLAAAAALAAVLMRADLSAEGNEGGRRIGAVYMTMNNPFYTIVDNRLLLKVDSMGDVLLTRDPELDQERQNQQIQDLLEEGIDLLVVTPVEREGVLPALEQVRRAGIPIIVVDTPTPDYNYADCTIWSDNYDAGAQCAKDLMRRRDEATILLLEHDVAKSARDRIQGFLDTIDGNDRYKVMARIECWGQLEIAMPETAAFLDQHGPVDAIMALNDPSALGALEALESRGQLGGTLVYGVDGTPEAKALIQDGLMTATAAQSVYRLGDLVGEAAYRILNGEPVEREVVIPVELITAENLADYNVDGWQ